MKKADLLMGYTTFMYLGLPVLIFFFGWLRIDIALPLSALLIWGSLRYLAGLASETRSIATINRKSLLLVVGLSFVWVFLSGIGGFSNQDWDHHFRNALFRDLITEPWPVYYNFPAHYPIEALANHHSSLNYYFTFWLLPAWAGKLFGQEVGNICLLTWSYIGILLGLYYLNRLFDFKYAGFVSLLFILWSGLDVLGKLILQKHLVYPGEQIELYYHYFFTAFTTDLYNPFNQAIPAWLITAWVLNYHRKLNLLPTTFLLTYAPFPFIGLVSFYYINYLSAKFSSGTTFKNVFLDLLSELTSIETVAALFLAVTYALFYQAHTSDVPSSLFWTRYLETDPVQNLKTIVSYFVTFFLEAGVYFGLIFLLSKNVYQTYKRPFWLCFGLLLIIPLWAVGEYNDFASRGSIPALVILCVLTAKAILDQYTNQRKRYMLFISIVTLLLSWITPAILIKRGIPVNGNPIFRDAIGSFADPKVRKQNDNESVLTSVVNFYAHEPQQHIFYKYLAKPLSRPAMQH